MLVWCSLARAGRRERRRSAPTTLSHARSRARRRQGAIDLTKSNEENVGVRDIISVNPSTEVDVDAQLFEGFQRNQPRFASVDWPRSSPSLRSPAGRPMLCIRMPPPDVDEEPRDWFEKSDEWVVVEAGGEPQLCCLAQPPSPDDSYEEWEVRARPHDRASTPLCLAVRFPPRLFCALNDALHVARADTDQPHPDRPAVARQTSKGSDAAGAPLRARGALLRSAFPAHTERALLRVEHAPLRRQSGRVPHVSGARRCGWRMLAAPQEA